MYTEDNEISILESRKKQIEEQIRELNRELNMIEMRLQGKRSPTSWVCTSDKRDIPYVTM